VHNRGWQYMLWDRQDCEALLAQAYPWFLPTWLALPSLVLQSDAIRPFILHAHGGVYLDLDTECFR
jgi:mannosyltransferase OCH1-like enzyme